LNATSEQGPDEDPGLEAFEAEDDAPDPAAAGSLLGAVAQMTAAVVVVVLILAAFIAGAVLLRSVFR
jgi:hypothetical protein